MSAPRSPSHLLFWTLAALALLLAWDASGLDIVLARPLTDEYGFFWKRHWVLEGVLHDGARLAAWVPAVWIVVGVWLPSGTLAQVARRERIQWAVTTLLVLMAINLLKQSSHTSCPWDLAEFGGRAHAHWISHWAWHIEDGGAGRCFPAGHASAGFAFFGGFFALRRQLPGAARAWLVGTLLVGFTLGIAQQLRGAHFMSHTLWTAWLCWTIAWAIDIAFRRFSASRPLAIPKTQTLPVEPVQAS